MTADVGPWGICFVTNDVASLCVPVARLTDTDVITVMGNPPEVVYGSAAADASKIVVTLKDGSTLQVRVMAVSDGKLWAFGLVKGQQVSSLAAYDASGKLVWSGKLPH